MSDLVTGDAVVLELRLAKLASRSLALTIDLAVQFACPPGRSRSWWAGSAPRSTAALGAALGLTFLVAVIVGYPVAMETSTRGRSLGKMALGLRVVREDGGPVRFRQAFVRGLLSVVEIWISLGSIAFIASLASSQGKRLGDYLAGTVVVHERVPVAANPVALMPPPLAGWATTLDLSRLPDDLALAARQFLSRAAELSPAAREDMGSRIVAAMQSVTTPPPPPGTPPWAYLAAVLAERRRRELLRLGAPGAPGGATYPPSALPTAGVPAAATRRRPPAVVRRRTASTSASPAAPGVRRRPDRSGNPFAPPG